MLKLAFVIVGLVTLAAVGQERQFKAWSWQTSTSYDLSIGIRQKFGKTDFIAVFTLEGPLESKNRRNAHPEYEVHQKSIFIRANDGIEVDVNSAFPNVFARQGTYAWRYSVHGRFVMRGKFNHRTKADMTEIITVYPTQFVDKVWERMPFIDD